MLRAAIRSERCLERGHSRAVDKCIGVDDGADLRQNRVLERLVRGREIEKWNRHLGRDSIGGHGHEPSRERHRRANGPRSHVGCQKAPLHSARSRILVATDQRYPDFFGGLPASLPKGSSLARSGRGSS